jgi:hypothetical protein
MNADSNSEISALRNQIFILLVALIVISGTLTVYLYRQASITRKDMDAMKPQAQQLIGAFNQNQKLMIEFVNQLVAYGQTHPEFRPVLMKYSITPPPAGAAAPAAPKK